MTYISFPAPPQSTGRTVRDACSDPVTGAYVCEVGELLDGDKEISADEHERIKKAADAWYDDNPPAPSEVVPLPPTIEEQFAALKAIVESIAPEAVAASLVLVSKD